MTIAFSTPIPVVQLTQNFSFEMYESGQRGVRVYVDASIRPDVTSESLPAIGSSWSDDYKGCRLRTIRVSYIQDNDNCGRRFECSYDTQSNDDSNSLTNESGAGVTNDVNKLACQMEVGSESVTWEPIKKPLAAKYPTNTKFTHLWNGVAGQFVEQLLFKRTVTGQFGVERLITASKISAFLLKSFSHAGTINSVEFFGCPAGTVLYQGCNMSKTWTQFGTSTKMQWKGNLIFLYKGVTYDPRANADGWNYVLREDSGLWQRPKAVAPPAGENGYLYQSTDFTELMTFGGWDVDLPNLSVGR